MGCAGTVIPDSVTKIGAGAFQDCTSLDTIVIPASVTDMKGYAFEGCTGLTSIVVAAGNEKYDSRNSCDAIIETETNTLILACQNTVIPDSVKTIGYLSFSTSAKSVVIPNTITRIEHCAFKDCKGLESITIPSSVSVIPDSAFEGCTDLTSINIPDSVTEIGRNALSGCNSLTSIVIPDSVTQVGYCCFSGCSALMEVSVKSADLLHNTMVTKDANIIVREK